MKAMNHALKHQPIPKLSDTLSTYMKSVSPSLRGLQKMTTRLMLDLYGVTHAKRQQSLLELARNGNTNWCAEGLARMWLRCRGGLPFHNNYSLLLHDDAAITSMTERAARLIAAALSVHKDMLAGRLMPDMEANHPLEMRHYRRCFGTARLPQPHCDQLQSVENTHYIAIMAAGEVYCLSLDNVAAEISWPQIQTALDRIVAEVLPNAHIHQRPQPGLLSALPREQWASTYGDMLKVPLNQQGLSTLSKALFVVCLDVDAQPGSLKGAAALLRDGNCHNRYFDKSMQIIVTANAKAGLCFERAAVDGSVALGFTQRLLERAASLKANVSSSRSSNIRARKLHWDFNNVFRDAMTASRTHIQQQRTKRSLETWTLAETGRNHFLFNGVSADAMLQIALQAATQLEFGKPLGLFEPVHTRHFSGGRMDFISPITEESSAVTALLRDGDSNTVLLASRLRLASHAHRNLIARAKRGRGLLSHILALEAVQEQSTENPSLLRHLEPGQQLTTQCDMLAANGSGVDGVAAFAPACARPNMIGVGYVIEDHRLSIDLRADGRYRDHLRGLKAHIDRVMRQIITALERTPARNWH